MDSRTPARLSSLSSGRRERHAQCAAMRKPPEPRSGGLRRLEERPGYFDLPFFFPFLMTTTSGCDFAAT